MITPPKKSFIKLLYHSTEWIATIYLIAITKLHLSLFHTMSYLNASARADDEGIDYDTLTKEKQKNTNK